ncbi:MAG TPA: DMT family transporter [Acetobacteraceae bacterium]|nr:DMT family transporter [Acetobacteraceae bacterium]
MPARPDATGLLLLLATVTGWGLNWPIMKVLLSEIPPFTIRAVTGVIGVALLLPLAVLMRQSLRVPRGLRLRLVLASLLNVTAWMGLASFSLLWLAAGEATIVCYTMPVWTSLLAWAVLGERPGWRRVVALGLAFAGLAVLVLGEGVQAGIGKLPGVGFALAAAILFSLGTVITKRWPVPLPPVASVAWQIGLGIAPLILGAVLFDRADPLGVSAGGWVLLLYGGIGPLALCYLAWFAALRRLPAGAAAAGTLLTPVVGVFSAAVALGEPLGLREVLALGLTVSGVVLAVRG